MGCYPHEETALEMVDLGSWWSMGGRARRKTGGDNLAGRALNQTRITDDEIESFGMALKKHREDNLSPLAPRYWFRTSGATRKEFDLLNALFIDPKVAAMQRLFAEGPDGTEDE